MKDEFDLDALDAEVTRVSDELAARHRFEDLTPAMRRVLHRPYWTAGLIVAAGLALIGVGVWSGRWRPALYGGAVLAVWLPGQVRDVLQRRHRAGRMNEELFAELAHAAQRRLTGDLIYLIACVPLWLALAVVTWSFPSAAWPLWGLIAVGLSIPYHVFVRIPRSARESREADRWAGIEDDEDGLDEDEEEDDGDEALVLPIAKGLVTVFVLYIAPILAAWLGFRALQGPDDSRPTIAASVLALASAFTWWRLLTSEEEEPQP